MWYLFIVRSTKFIWPLHLSQNNDLAAKRCFVTLDATDTSMPNHADQSNPSEKNKTHPHASLLLLFLGDDAIGVRWMDMHSAISLYASHVDMIKQVVFSHDALW
jgi:hypothetical protein